MVSSGIHNISLGIAMWHERFLNYNPMLTLNMPCISESCIEMKIKFLFSHFFVVAQKALLRPRGGKG